ncbi:MAG TPA: glycosyltransferase family A protein [Solirubrobacteraceae bacterium]|jgi:glycosyltransferase involved in cell wall biosynthesis|nr:glycosyltransferase family A protein [Solirubrobacteraceae bacterium]
MSHPRPAETPVVSVIVPARDAGPTLGRTLAAISRQDLPTGFEVLLVDDGSTDETLAIARTWEPAVRIIRSESSRGPGAARNLGAAQARGSILAFTDSDCFPAPGWLSAGVRAIEAGADLVQGAVRPDPAVARTPFDRTVVVAGDAGLYPTANVFVRRELFDSLGGFCDWLLEHEQRTGKRRFTPADRRRLRATRTPIGEDTLFAWSGRRRGARTAFAPDAIVDHAVVAGTLRDEILDRWHWARDMPGVAALVPELREACFYRRWFFSRKTARFDFAVACLALSIVTRRVTPLAGTWPYLDWIATEARRMGGADGARHALGSIASDGATLAALLTGSVTWRCPLL